MFLNVYAYTVIPQRTNSEAVAPVGRQIRLSSEIESALNNAFTLSGMDRGPSVDFNFPSGTRINEVREAIMRIAFGDGNDPLTNSRWLATRLGGAMDNRSHSALFVVAVAADDNDEFRRLTMWAFPRDEAFQFDGDEVSLLTDVFSKSSTLRKAALFEGKNANNQFLNGRVYDIQTRKHAADFWVTRFLDCRSSVSGETGTRLLADYLRNAHKKATNDATREQLSAAIIGVRHPPKKRISFSEFANQYLHDEGKKLFLQQIPNNQTLASRFSFDIDQFDKTLGFRVFGLDSGVIVSSPFDQVGDKRCVQITDGDGGRSLQCHGRVLSEKVRSSHGLSIGPREVSGATPLIAAGCDGT